MEIHFDKEYLSELYYNGKASGKKQRFLPHVVKRYKRRIDLLEGADSINDLLSINSLRYEVLTGNNHEVSSIKVNDMYCIEFTTSQVETGTIVTICDIVELSNHINRQL